MDQITVLKTTHNTNLKCESSYKSGSPLPAPVLQQHDLACFFRLQVTQCLLTQNKCQMRTKNIRKQTFKQLYDKLEAQHQTNSMPL